MVPFLCESSSDQTCLKVFEKLGTIGMITEIKSRRLPLLFILIILELGK